MQGFYNAIPIHECSYSSKLPNIKKGLILTPNLITKLGKIDFLFGSSAYQKTNDTKSKRAISARINREVKSPSPSVQKNNENKPNSNSNVENRKISVIFDNIFFDKIFQSDLLKKISEVKIADIYVLSPTDERIPFLTKMVAKIFHEINCDSQNLLICQKIDDSVFYIFFTDWGWIPCSKCCEYPVFIVIKLDSLSQIMCMNKNCSGKCIQEIKFSEKNLNETFYNQKKEENYLRKQVSNFISTRKFLTCNIRKCLKDEKNKFRAQTARTRVMYENLNIDDYKNTMYSPTIEKKSYEPILKNNGQVERSYQIKMKGKDPLEKIEFLLKSFKKL